MFFIYISIVTWSKPDIVGEGMTFDKVKEQHSIIKSLGLPLGSFAWGVGAGFYKDIERDTLGWAMKTGYSNGAPRIKFSEDKRKRSIPGKVNLIRDLEGNLLVTQHSDDTNNKGIYETIFENGKTKELLDLKEVRDRALNSDIGQRRILLDTDTGVLIDELGKKHLRKNKR